jgi:hypothetical protein
MLNYKHQPQSMMVWLPSQTSSPQPESFQVSLGLNLISKILIDIMPAKKTTEEIEATIRKEFDGTPYAISTLTPLTGGSANFIYHAKLQNSLPDGSSEVVLKHGEGYVALHPEFSWTMLRCVSTCI